jgi:hypothetical protein
LNTKNTKNTNAIKYVITLVVLTVVALAAAAMAQGSSARLAYVNGSGQLVIINVNGDARWIVTNPGEQLSLDVGLAWSPDSEQVLFAVQQGGQSELRLADANNQTVTTLVSLNRVSGGEWTPDGSIIVGTADGLVRLDLNTRQAEVVVAGGQFINGDVVAPSGNAMFFYQAGSFAVRSQAGSITALPGRNNTSATNVGLWAPRQPFVAYWAFNDRGNATINVTNANTAETVIIDSQSAVPVTPLTWVPGTTQLLYRSAMGVMAVDASCLQSGCGSAPAPVQILPVTASNVATSANGALFYSDANVVYSVASACVSAGDCTQNRVQLGPIAGNTVAMAALDTAAFTGADGTVQVINDLGCTQSGTCTLTATGLNGTVFSLAPGGNHLLIDTRDALQLVDVQSGRVAATLNGLNRGAPFAWSN